MAKRKKKVHRKRRRTYRFKKAVYVTYLHPYGGKGAYMLYVKKGDVSRKGRRLSVTTIIPRGGCFIRAARASSPSAALKKRATKMARAGYNVVPVRNTFIVKR